MLLINNTMLLLLSLVIEVFYVTLAGAAMFWSLALMLRVWTIVDPRLGLRWHELRVEIFNLRRVVLRVWLALYFCLLLEGLLRNVC